MLGQQHHKKIAPFDALTNFGRPIRANGHADINEDVMPSFFQAGFQITGKLPIIVSDSAIGNKKLSRFEFVGLVSNWLILKELRPQSVFSNKMALS